MWFQQPASLIMEGIIDLQLEMSFHFIYILTLVTYGLVGSIILFNEREQQYSSTKTKANSWITLEFIYSNIPILIIAGIFAPIASLYVVSHEHPSTFVTNLPKLENIYTPDSNLPYTLDNSLDNVYTFNNRYLKEANYPLYLKVNSPRYNPGSENYRIEYSPLPIITLRNQLCPRLIPLTKPIIRGLWTSEDEVLFQWKIVRDVRMSEARIKLRELSFSSDFYGEDRQVSSWYLSEIEERYYYRPDLQYYYFVVNQN